MNYLVRIMLACMLAFAIQVHAFTIWTPTDGTVNTVDINFGGSGIFGFFDADDTGFAGTYIRLENIDNIQVLNTSGGWIAQSKVDNESITLGATPAFILAHSSNGGLTWMGDTSTTSGGAGTDTYVLTFGALRDALGIADVRPIATLVPIPEPAGSVLLAMGLTGLMLLRRRLI